MEFEIINELLTNDEYLKKNFNKLNEDMFTNYKTVFKLLKKFNDEYSYSSDSIEDFKAYLSLNKYLEVLKINRVIRNNDVFNKLTETFIKNNSIEKPKKLLGITLWSKHKKEDKINFIKSSIDSINKCVGGGFIKKSTYAFIGKTNVGKSLILCSLAADLYLQGQNVLYITGELDENIIESRILANILNIDIQEVQDYSSEYLDSITQNKSNTNNKLMIKKYSINSASIYEIEDYLSNLKEENFIPDIIILDYITLFKSISYNKGSVKDYMYIKALCEEFQGFAYNNNIVLITAMQLNRYGASINKIEDINMTNTAGSWDSISVFDFIGIIFQDQVRRINSNIQIKVDKTRQSDNNELIYDFDIDYKKMKIS